MVTGGVLIRMVFLKILENSQKKTCARSQPRSHPSVLNVSIQKS